MSNVKGFEESEYSAGIYKSPITLNNGTGPG